MFLKIIFCNLFVTLFAVNLPNFPSNSEEELGKDYWDAISKRALFETYHQKDIHHKAKNVILFLGDGMGVSTITPSRILKGQLQKSSGEEAKLAFEDFPNTCLIKTYNVDYQVPDSAGAATAFLTGVKTNMGVIGVTARVKRGEANCETVQKNSLHSIFDYANEQGKSTGVVTNTRITHATPAGAYASVADRNWEGSIPTSCAHHPTHDDCKDIARQLIENHPGKNLNVIMGGGARYFYPKNYTEPTSGVKGERWDGLNLVDKWLDQQTESATAQEHYKFVNSREQLLNAVQNPNLNHLFGLFNADHMNYDKERDPLIEPSLAEMTEAAIKVLEKNDRGYVLLVEGGRIDMAHHESYANLALYETVAFDKAIERALKLVNTDETLVVVTADHSHAFTMNGYPQRGHNIMGIADNDHDSGKPFTTLMYANGPGYKENRTDPSTVDTSDLRYQSHTAVFLWASNHGGEDVALYSTGPMSHLFRGTKEQSYVAHAMEFAACVGPYQHYDHCYTPKHSSGSVVSQNISVFVFFAFNFILIKVKFFINN